MPFRFGPVELLIIFGVILLLFGARRLPETGKAMGKALRGFRDAVTGKDSPDEDEV